MSFLSITSLQGWQLFINLLLISTVTTLLFSNCDISIGTQNICGEAVSHYIYPVIALMMDFFSFCVLELQMHSCLCKWFPNIIFCFQSVPHDSCNASGQNDGCSSPTPRPRMTVSSQSGPRSPRPPEDLISTATSALRRLHFKTGRCPTKNTNKQQVGINI